MESSVGFYPSCESNLATIGTTIYNDFIDPLQSMPFDYENNIWSPLILTGDTKVRFFFDEMNDQTIAFITRQLSSSGADVHFKCRWNGIFGQQQSLNVSIATSTGLTCKFDDITSEYCSNNWDCGLQFCDNSTSPIHLSLWNNPITKNKVYLIKHNNFL